MAIQCVTVWAYRYRCQRDVDLSPEVKPRPITKLLLQSRHEAVRSGQQRNGLTRKLKLLAVVGVLTGWCEYGTSLSCKKASSPTHELAISKSYTTPDCSFPPYRRIGDLRICFSLPHPLATWWSEHLGPGHGFCCRYVAHQENQGPTEIQQLSRGYSAAKLSTVEIISFASPGSKAKDNSTSLSLIRLTQEGQYCVSSQSSEEADNLSSEPP
ncbi:hypothetical protein BDV97DRAFT_109041 [Delphinella strobiligena]|nr:hypothetical protein BDV97DRAFT_109041 [Delphinella strobiligena]